MNVKERSDVRLGLKRLLVCVLVIQGLSSGCTTGRVRLESSPSGATVRVKAVGDGAWKEAGVTPLTLASTNFKSPGGVGSGPLIFEFSKDGFETSKAVVTEATTSDVFIEVDLEARSTLDRPGALNGLIDRMFESQSLIRAGRYEDALEKLRGIEREAPQLSAVYELEGGIYYLTKRYREALDAYALADKLNPQNPQVMRMRQALETSLNSQREPASLKPSKVFGDPK